MYKTKLRKISGNQQNNSEKHKDWNERGGPHTTCGSHSLGTPAPTPAYHILYIDVCSKGDDQERKKRVKYPHLQHCESRSHGGPPLKGQSKQRAHSLEGEFSDNSDKMETLLAFSQIAPGGGSNDRPCSAAKPGKGATPRQRSYF